MNELKKYIAQIDISEEDMLLDESEKQRLMNVDSILNQVSREPSQDINQRIEDLEYLIIKLQKEIASMSDDCNKEKGCPSDFMKNKHEVILESQEEGSDTSNSTTRHSNATLLIIDNDKKDPKDIIKQDIEVVMSDLKNEINRKLQTVKDIKLDADDSSPLHKIMFKDK